LDAERDASLSELERAAAREHASVCSRCAALQDSWQAARVELHALRIRPLRRRLPRASRCACGRNSERKHGTVKTRRVAVMAAWVLAAATVLAGAVSWSNWRKSQQEEATRHLAAPQNSAEAPAADGGQRRAGRISR